MKRINELTATEIGKFLNGEAESPYRPCQLASRLGELATDPVEGANAQALLVPFLTEGCPHAKWGVVKLLLGARSQGTASPETLQALKTFESGPEGAEIVQQILREEEAPVCAD